MTLEYLAGFFDGEGCVSLSGREWTVSACQTEKNGTAMLFAMQRRWGGSVFATAPANERCSPVWRWKAKGVEAAIALHDMAPFLSVKAEKAATCLSDLRARHGGKIGRILDRLREPTNIFSEP